MNIDVEPPTEDGPSDLPNKTMRKMLAERWKTMPEDKQLSIRAARSKRGIKCPICGKIGYFRENCPNECVSPPGTPDSWASSPPGTPPKSPVGLGVLWGDQSEKPPSPLRYDYKKKVDINTVRPPAQTEQKRLRDLDSKIGTFAFFAESEEGYADSYAQMTLHQVMRRLMRLLERQLYKNAEDLEATFDTTLLHPPFHQETEKFYPDELKNIKEYRDYFIKKEIKLDNKKKYQNQSSVRCIDELDILFRGNNLNDNFLYKTNPKAGASMHSKNTWKSVLSNSDMLASSDPIMAKKEEKLQQLFYNQSKWIKLQKQNMLHKNDRYEHLVYILKEEIKKEHQRESEYLLSTKHSNKTVEMKIYQDRLDTVDKIMKCLQAYNFTSGLDEADFLFFCFDKWKETLENKLYGKNIHRPKKYVQVKDKKNNPLQRTASTSSIGTTATAKTTGTTVTTGSRQSKDDSTTAPANTSGPGLDYNRMISAANPYAKDLAFLDYMKKKHHRIRMKAMEPQFTTDSVTTGPSLHGRADPATAATVGGGAMHRQVSFASDVSAMTTRNQHLSPQGTTNTISPMKPHFAQLLVPGDDDQLDDQSISSQGSVLEHNTISKQQLVVHNTTTIRKTQKNFTIKRRLHPREVDAQKIEQAKGAFRRAGLKGHIRKGEDSDLAYLAPTLIPVPGAFQADGSNPMISHTAENILFSVKKNMILSDIGYTPQSMVPLYARNTLMETNGTTPGGDQNYLVMATDRRYSHYVGRPLNRFEPEDTTLKMNNSAFHTINEEILKDSLSNPNRQLKLMQSILNKNISNNNEQLKNKKIQEKLIEKKRIQLEKTEKLREYRQERRLIHEEMEKVKGLPITKSLVRMAFKDPLPGLENLAYLDD